MENNLTEQHKKIADYFIDKYINDENFQISISASIFVLKRDVDSNKKNLHHTLLSVLSNLVCEGYVKIPD